jgi:hypothetical protein
MSAEPQISETLSSHLRACEEALLDPKVRRDPARVAEFLCEDFEEFGSSGRVWSRRQILDLLATEDYQPPAMEDFQCAPIAESVALVTYKTVRVLPDSSERSVILRSTILVEQSGQWRARFHQGTKAPQG